MKKISVKGKQPIVFTDHGNTHTHKSGQVLHFAKIYYLLENNWSLFDVVIHFGFSSESIFIFFL